MKLQEFRFKKEFYQIEGIFNIPGFIICNGFGSDLITFCCKNCGEIFVIDNEYLFRKSALINEITKDLNCPSCKIDLENHLVSYPENLFHEGKLFKNTNAINKLHFENTELIEVYLFP